MDEPQLKGILEALLLSAHKPLSLEQMRSVFDEATRPSLVSIKQILAELALDYQDRAVGLKTLSSGYCFQTKIEYAPWISRLYAEKPVKYSRALLETLAVIAYKQPVTRADIEDIRGVSLSTPLLKTLLDREWIRVAGHRDLPGKPAVYVTTKAFLDYFNMASIQELPAL